jgi:Pyruvate/2-oxoacid:ferredoxin oxidoreductase delta subunit
VPAIGQDPDVSGLQDLLETESSLVHIDARQQASRDGFFAGGDLVTTQRFVTVAFGSGKLAATEIDRFLHAGAPARDRPTQPQVSIDVINTNYHPRYPRAAQQLVPATARQVDFNEVELGLSVDEVLAESRRCFSCGNCTLCDNCFYYCPDMAISREDGGYSVDEDFCKGCGLCVRECPTGSLIMQRETS